MSDLELAVIAIADGTKSVSRIVRLLKAIYNLDASPQQIVDITASKGIPTPNRAPVANKLEQQYPDEWSIFLEALSFWTRVRRYWGDDKAIALKTAIALSNEASWRGLFRQFARYIDPHVRDRADIDLQVLAGEPNELESLYAWEMQKAMYLQASDREWANDPAPKTGVKFPIASPEWTKFKAEKYEADCLALSPSEDELIEFFRGFWRKVRTNRGQEYFESLKRASIGSAAAHESYRPFYTATEDNFRHFLSNLRGFENNASWNIPKLRPATPISMKLQGALWRHGWERVRSLLALAVAIGERGSDELRS